MNQRTSAIGAALWAVITSVFLAGCLGIGSCTETEAFAFNSVRQYDDVDLVPEGQSSGGCGATLVTGDDPDAVIEHYRSEFERVGFVLDPVESTPIVDESGAVIGRTLSMQGTVETATVSVNAEVLDGQDTTFLILTNEVH